MRRGGGRGGSSFPSFQRVVARNRVTQVAIRNILSTARCSLWFSNTFTAHYQETVLYCTVEKNATLSKHVDVCTQCPVQMIGLYRKHVLTMVNVSHSHSVLPQVHMTIVKNVTYSNSHKIRYAMLSKIRN